jgi:uncharacterized protein YjbJ (UPF0337 family)
MSGTTDKIKGAVKENVGKVTGDRQLETDGKIDKAKGHIKDALHEAKETVKDQSK